MNAIDKRMARQVTAGLVSAGAVMAAIGASSLDPQVATVLPPIGAALVAAGLVVLVQAEALSGRRAVIVGAALLTAGVVMTVIGSIATQVAVTAAVVPLGGALAAAGTISLVSGAAAVDSKAWLRAR
jgi:hypothetical protein